MEDINDLIAANTGLVYMQLHRFKLINDQDAESLAYEALHKAILSFNSTRDTNLSTYAVCVISNALRGHLRTLNKKRQIRPLSYDVQLIPDDEDSGYMIDLLHDADSTEDCVVNDEKRRMIRAALDKVRAGLKNVNYIHVFDIWNDSDFQAKQSDIARCLGLSQATVSHILSVIKYRLRQELEDYL